MKNQDLLTKYEMRAFVMHIRESGLLIGLLMISSVVFGQPDRTTVTISGEVLKPMSFTLEDLAGMSTVTLKATGHDNNEHSYTGVTLYELLKVAGVTLGGQLRGENLAKYVLVTAADNYQVVYALPELDPEFTNDVVLLATMVDGKPLPKGEGPFRLVNPADKKHARWIREIKSIKVQFVKD